MFNKFQGFNIVFKDSTNFLAFLLKIILKFSGKKLRNSSELSISKVNCKTLKNKTNYNYLKKSNESTKEIHNEILNKSEIVRITYDHQKKSE